MFKSKIQSDGSLEKLKLRIMVRVDLQNKYLVVDTLSPTAYMRTFQYYLEYAVKHKARVHRLDFIVAFFQSKVKNRVFVRLDGRYAYYLPEYSNYFGIFLILLKSMYGITNSEKLFSYELTGCLLD